MVENKIRTDFLPTFRPNISDDEINEVVKTLKSDWITTGPKTKEFENELKKYIDCKHAIALNSCTAALHLSLVALGVKEGDEVITTPFTFVSTANVILHQKAKPIFVDIKKDNFNINPDLIEDKITSKTKAIITVDYAGHPCDYDKIQTITKKNNIHIIEDAAHALGAKYNGENIGKINDTTCFSFYATKNITTGEGGMVTTENNELAEKIRILSLHGISKDAWKRYSSEGSWFYEIIYPGYKYNFTDIQSSIGIHQIRRLKEFQKQKKKIVEIYNESFEKISGINPPVVRKNVEHAWHLYPITIEESKIGINRNQFIEELKKLNIGTSVHFIPIHMHRYYKEKFGFKDNDFPIASDVYKKILSLPLFSKMTENDAYDVINAIKIIIKKHGI